MSGKRPARKVIAEAIKALKKDSVRVSPETHTYLAGKLAAALKSAYPSSFDVEAFLRECGV
jgi:hypothetical protein